MRLSCATCLSLVRRRRRGHERGPRLHRSIRHSSEPGRVIVCATSGRRTVRCQRTRRDGIFCWLSTSTAACRLSMSGFVSERHGHGCSKLARSQPSRDRQVELATQISNHGGVPPRTVVVQSLQVFPFRLDRRRWPRRFAQRALTVTGVGEISAGRRHLIVEANARGPGYAAWYRRSGSPARCVAGRGYRVSLEPCATPPEHRHTTRLAVLANPLLDAGGPAAASAAHE